MHLNDYQDLSGKTAHFPDEKAIEYTTIALCGEAGEYANEVKKMIRNDLGVLTPERLGKLKDELGDTLWYVAQAAKALGATLEEIAEINIAKLQKRYGKDGIQRNS